MGVWYLAGPLVLVPLTLLCGAGLLAALTGRCVRRAAHNLAVAEERRFNFLFDTLNCIHGMKVLGAEPPLERRYERLQGGSARLRRTLAQTIAAGQEGGLLLAHDGSGLASDDTAAWTDQIEPGSIQGVVPHHAADFDRPATDHVQIVNDLQADKLRVSWS